MPNKSKFLEGGLMSKETTYQPGTWSIGSSIAMELDVALSYITKHRTLPVPRDILGVKEAIPDDWLVAWNELWGKPENYQSVLETSARLAGVVEGDDYANATLTIRELTIETALENLTLQTRALGLSPDLNSPPAESLQDLYEQQMIFAYTQIGMDVSRESEVTRRARHEVANAIRVISGGDLHTRFWQLLDRFYYESYRSWRGTRVEAMNQLTMRARTALGSQDKLSDINWLPAQSPMLRLSELYDAVIQGNLHVFFWVEPFGLTDSWSLAPGYVAVSFAEAGSLYEDFQTLADDVAGRAKALGDPTRLIILRIIRNFGMINTDIANFLGISRPTVSVHAKILREAGLIQSRQEGRLVRHELVASEVRRLFRDLENFLDLTEE
jgi:DNA-binding transcriptional ArsR family regulator